MLALPDNAQHKLFLSLFNQNGLELNFDVVNQHKETENLAETSESYIINRKRPEGSKTLTFRHLKVGVTR